MSKVELSIQEYDALKEEIALYKKVFDAIITPAISDWEVERIQACDGYPCYISSGDILNKLSISDREILKNRIEQSVRLDLRKKGFHGSDIEVSFIGGVTATICGVKMNRVEEE